MPWLDGILIRSINFLGQFTIKGGNTRLIMGIDKDTDASVIKNLVLSDYEKLLDEANKENQDVPKTLWKICPYKQLYRQRFDNSCNGRSKKKPLCHFVSIYFLYSVAGLKEKPQVTWSTLRLVKNLLQSKKLVKNGSKKKHWIKRKAQKELASHVK